MKDDSDKNRITLAMAFIATYVAIIFSFPKLLDVTRIDGFNVSSFLLLFAYVSLIVLGSIIVILLFVYLLASAQELIYKKDDQIFNSQQIEKTKKSSFDNAVKLMYLSIYGVPGAVLGGLFVKYNLALIDSIMLRYRLFILLIAISLIALLVFIRKDIRRQ